MTINRHHATTPGLVLAIMNMVVMFCVLNCKNKPDNIKIAGEISQIILRSGFDQFRNFQDLR